MAMLLSPKIFPVLMLIASNVFMTFAWYGHLKFKAAPLYAAVIFSWLIAFFEYCLEEGITWNHVAGFVLIAGGAGLIFRG